MAEHDDPRWAAVYRSFDVLSPWNVGRFRDAKSTDDFYRTVVAPDVSETRRLGIDYLPVLFPGFSWHKLKGTPPLNQIPRRSPRRTSRFRSLSCGEPHECETGDCDSVLVMRDPWGWPLHALKRVNPMLE